MRQAEGKWHAWAESTRRTLLLSRPFCDGKSEKQCSAQTKLTILVVVPLRHSVCAATVTSGAHRESRNPPSDWNIGIRRAEAKVGSDSKMPVNRTQSFKHGRIGR